MGPFRYFEGQLFCDEVPLELIARTAGTPCYVYSANSILSAFGEYRSALADLPHMVCYAVKANSNLAIIRLLAGAGSGFDIVSGGELFRVLRAGGTANRIVFSGVGKTADEIEYALVNGIHSFNCESEAELGLIDGIAARLATKAKFSLRINPDVSADTHPYISTGLTDHKFGIDLRTATKVYRAANRFANLIPEGLSCHVGSQILDPSPILEAAEKLLDFAVDLRAAGIGINHVDIGGGLGIAYRSGENSPSPSCLLNRLNRRLRETKLAIFVEPGRSIVGQAGALLTKVLYRKQNGEKDFAVVDAAMNDLIRPALYESHHEILPLRASGEREVVDVVGPVCETGDFLARNRPVAGAYPGDFLAIASAGAYGFAQSSNYNSRPRAAEVLVEGAQWRIVRARETWEDLIRGEEI